MREEGREGGRGGGREGILEGGLRCRRWRWRKAVGVCGGEGKRRLSDISPNYKDPFITSKHLAR